MTWPLACLVAVLLLSAILWNQKRTTELTDRRVAQELAQDAHEVRLVLDLRLRLLHQAVDSLVKDSDWRRALASGDTEVVRAMLAEYKDSPAGQGLDILAVVDAHGRVLVDGSNPFFAARPGEPAGLQRLLPGWWLGNLRRQDTIRTVLMSAWELENTVAGRRSLRLMAGVVLDDNLGLMDYLSAQSGAPFLALAAGDQVLATSQTLAGLPESLRNLNPETAAETTAQREGGFAASWQPLVLQGGQVHLNLLLAVPDPDDDLLWTTLRREGLVALLLGLLGLLLGVVWLRWHWVRPLRELEAWLVRGGAGWNAQPPTGPVREYNRLALELAEVARPLMAARENLDRLWRNMSGPMLIWDRHQRLVDCNRTALDLCGYAVEELRGRPLEQFFGGGLSGEHQEILRQVFTGDSSRTMETSVFNVRTGARRELSWSIFLLSPERPGAAPQAMALGQDLTTLRYCQKAVTESEERFQATFEQAAVGICLASPDGQILRLNQRMANILSCQRSDLVGANLRDLVPPEDVSTLDQMLTRLLTGDHRPVMEQRRLIWGSGAEVWVGQTCSLVTDRQDRPKMILVVMQDITQVKRQEARLAWSGRIAQQVGEGVAVLDPQGVLVFVNPAWARMHGLTVVEMEDRPVDICHTPEQMANEIRPLLESVASRGAFSGEIWHVGVDGRAFPTATTATRLTDENGQSQGCIVVARDISRDMEASQALRQSQRDLARAQEVARLGHWLWDLSSGRFSCSSLFLSLYGLEGQHEQIGPQHMVLWAHPEDRQRLQECLDAARERGRGFQLEHRVLWPNGETRHLRMRAEATLDHQGQPESLIGIAQDISDLKHTETRLRQSEERLKKAQAIASMGDWECRLHSGVVTLSEQAQTIMGLDTSELPGGLETLWDMVPPSERAYLEAEFNRALHIGGDFDAEHRLLRPDGETRWVHQQCQVGRDHLGRAVSLACTIQDLTDRRQSEDFMATATRVFETAVESVIVSGADGKIQSVNQAFTIITGYHPEEVIGKNPRFLQSDRHEPKYYHNIWKSLQNYGEWRGEIWNRRKNGEAYPEWVAITAIKDQRGRIVRYVSVSHDRSDIKHSQQMVEYQSNHDALTGLPNRALFRDRLEVALHHLAQGKGRAAVLSVDLDNFKTVNDSLGHASGDDLLRLVAERLVNHLGAEVTVSRLGGDEFVVMLENLSDMDQAVRYTQRVLDSFAQPFALDGQELFISAGVGVTISPDDGDDADTLIKNADLAMHRAKALGPGAYQLFTPAMNRVVNDRLRLENDLRRALERGEFILHYQPKVDATGQLKGMEALLRWHRNHQEMVSPLDFIPLAEQTGLIVPIGRWVLTEASRQTREWIDLCGRDIKVAVNFSARQFQEPDLVETVWAVLEQQGLAPELLEVEVTESLFMDQSLAAEDALARLAQRGVTITLDDFGTGFSSLAYLRRFPLSSLKLDKSFVDDLPRDPKACAVAGGIVALAHRLGYLVVAEGVESQGQLDFLVELGCDDFQGYYFHRPLTPADFQKLLTNQA